MIAPTLTTDRLTLRGHVMDDFAPLYALFASDRARYMGGPITARETYRWVASEVGSWVLQGIGSWGITRTDDGTFLGQVGINKPEGFAEVELGWVLLQEAEGHGYGHEAATAACNWWWDQPDATSLVSYIDPQNSRSIALAKRLGAKPDTSATLPTGETPDETVVYRHPMRGAA